MRAFVSTLLLLGIVFTSLRADACGFVSRRWRVAAEMPSAGHEDVLIVYDHRHHAEHFVRRVRFEKADESFGFIVPTPSQPKVHSGHGPLRLGLVASSPER